MYRKGYPIYKSEEKHELHEDALENLAGYIAKRCKLGEGFVQESGICSASTYMWVDELSEGGLKKPTEVYLSKIKQLENILL